MSPTEPRILLAGPGALGLLFAARLGRRWPGVHLLDHRPDRASQLHDRGLHVTGVTLADWTPPTGRVRTEAKSWPVMDAVLFFVKAHALAAAAKTAAPVIGPRTALVVFSEAADLSLFKTRSRQVVAALTDDRARMEGLGRVLHEAAGETFLDAAAPAAAALAAVFKAASIPVSLDKKIDDRRWLTLLAQICVDVPTALADAPQKQVLEPPLAGLGDKLLAECAALSKAMKRPVAPAALKARRDALINRAPEAKSSLGRDLLRGRGTERAALLDPLLAAAKKTKTPAPILASMDELVRRLEKEGPPA